MIRASFLLLAWCTASVAFAEPADKLPLSKLAPAKIHDGPLCVLKYPVTTRSPECQALCDQGLAYFDSYVYLEAVRSYETATRLDPECALAWWALSRSLERWKSKDALAEKALAKAKELLPKASHRESLLIKARLAEKATTGTPETRRKEAAKFLDELLSLYDDDEEGWYARALIANASDGGAAAVPYFKALLRVNPLHSGAHHELVHIYEGLQRPALGWQHALGYMESTPGIAHPFHMQSHLSMRIGKWDKTCDWALHAVEMEQAYHKEVGIKASEDDQYPHHLETLTVALIHDGRFAEAERIRKIAETMKLKHAPAWFRLAVAEENWPVALAVVDGMKRDKAAQSYLRAIVYLRKDKPTRALAEIDVLREMYSRKRDDKELELRLWETQGEWMVRTGEVDGGLRLLKKTIDATKDDYGKHSWGHGAYYMERWGIAAIGAGRLEVAEEAFLEAIAHDSRSVVGAVGMRVVCERQHRTEEASRFAELSTRCWPKADAGKLDHLLESLRTVRAPSIVTTARQEITR
jgi:tetratricopeptide (TPR) repeat protein